MQISLHLQREEKYTFRIYQKHILHTQSGHYQIYNLTETYHALSQGIIKFELKGLYVEQLVISKRSINGPPPPPVNFVYFVKLIMWPQQRPIACPSRSARPPSPS